MFLHIYMLGWDRINIMAKFNTWSIPYLNINCLNRNCANGKLDNL